MSKIKLVYEAPEAEVFEVRFSENMLSATSPTYGSKGAAGQSIEDGNEYDL